MPRPIRIHSSMRTTATLQSSLVLSNDLQRHAFASLDAIEVMMRHASSLAGLREGIEAELAIVRRHRDEALAADRQRQQGIETAEYADEVEEDKLPKINGTPGPWQVGHRDAYTVFDADGVSRGCSPIATMHGTPAEKRANARRIAALPELEKVASMALRMGQAGGYSPSTVEHAAREALLQAAGVPA